MYFGALFHYNRFVDIENLRFYQNKINEIQNEIAKVNPMHCQKCGDTKPKHGFAPIISFGNITDDNTNVCSTSSLLCNRCALSDEDYLKTFKEPKECF